MHAPLVHLQAALCFTLLKYKTLQILTIIVYRYNTKVAVTGRKAYNPVDMFKLYTYSYFNGIRSSRSRFSMLCEGLGLIGKEIIAIDGSKFHACNSANRYFNGGKVKRMLAHYESKAVKYLALLDTNDEEERKTPLPNMQRKDLEKKLRHIDERVAELTEQLEKIETDRDIALLSLYFNHFAVSHSLAEKAYYRVFILGWRSVSK